MRDDNDWKRQLLLGFSMLVVIGLLVGGLIAFVSLKAASVAGITSASDSTTPTPRSPASRTSSPASTTPTPTPPGGPRRTPHTASSPTSHPTTHTTRTTQTSTPTTTSSHTTTRSTRTTHTSTHPTSTPHHDTAHHQPDHHGAGTSHHPSHPSKPHHHGGQQPQHHPGPVTLHASRSAARPYQRIGLSGQIKQPGRLRVQRRLPGGSWQVFPASVGRSGSGFTTFVESGRRGANQFRVVANHGIASPSVTVQVR